jgi:RimJ/RimL family protein N-acetyltransferase
MPWALDEPQTLEQKVELLQRFRHHFDRGDDYPYAIFSADESEVLGGTGLHTRPAGAAYELGYWIRADRVRRGLVTEACAALTKVGFEHCRAKRLVIRVEPGNQASLGVPPKLGYRPTGSERSTDGRQLTVFTLAASDYPASAAAAAPVRAFDAGGSRLL